MLYSKDTSTPIHDRDSSSPSAGKSSGYASHPHSRSESSHSEEPIYIDKITPKNSATPSDFRNYKKSTDARKKLQYHPSPSSSSSSTGCHLTTIPEGKVDSVPRPVWPNTSPIESKHELEDSSKVIYDSLTNYITQLNRNENGGKIRTKDNKKRRACAEDLLRELSKTIEDVVDGKIQISPEELLQGFNHKISQTLNVLQFNTENEIRNLSHSISANEKLQVVTRALSNNSSSSRNSSLDDDEFYEIPSGSSSSGYSDLSPAANKLSRTITKTANSVQFVHRDLASVSNGVRNAMIYGTLCRTTHNIQQGELVTNAKLVNRNVSFSDFKSASVKKKLQAAHDDKPSVWENYYGAGITTGEFKLFARPTDTPTFVSTNLYIILDLSKLRGSSL